jgi:putative ABC transport system ATP-binding protein
MKPELLLADEPTGNLDTPQPVRRSTALLEELNHDGITLMVVTHDLALGKRARRLLGMCDGAISSDIVAGTIDAHA